MKSQNEISQSKLAEDSATICVLDTLGLKVLTLEQIKSEMKPLESATTSLTFWRRQLGE